MDYATLYYHVIGPALFVGTFVIGGGLTTMVALYVWDC